MYLIIKILVFTLLITFFLGGIVSISKSETIDDLVQREGMFYLKFSDIPFQWRIGGYPTRFSF